MLFHRNFEILHRKIPRNWLLPCELAWRSWTLSSSDQIDNGLPLRDSRKATFVSETLTQATVISRLRPVNLAARTALNGDTLLRWIRRIIRASSCLNSLKEILWFYIAVASDWGLQSRMKSSPRPGEELIIIINKIRYEPSTFLESFTSRTNHTFPLEHV